MTLLVNIDDIVDIEVLPFCLGIYVDTPERVSLIAQFNGANRLTRGFAVYLHDKEEKRIFLSDHPGQDEAVEFAQSIIAHVYRKATIRKSSWAATVGKENTQVIIRRDNGGYQIQLMVDGIVPSHQDRSSTEEQAVVVAKRLAEEHECRIAPYHWQK